MSHPRLLSTVLTVSFALACSAGAQKPAIETAMDDERLRRQSFEATLRVLDEHPEYVDEFFKLALEQHPVTLDRFIQNSARELRDEVMARITARYLARNPASLQRVLVTTLDASSDSPEALDAIARAMAERPQLSAIAVTQRSDALRSVMAALLDEVLKNHKAREAFVVSLQENSPELAHVIMYNPRALGALMKELMSVSTGEAEKLKSFVSGQDEDR